MIRPSARGSPDGRYDVVVLGGGVYGACTALEAARRGLRPLLLERDDFGGATSWNSLRILHGGLRYLQSADLPRFFESVAERRWFCRHFPELVEPLPCLMPLYGRGLKRPGVMRPVLAVNDLLAAGRDRGVDESVRLPGSRVLGPEETLRLYPAAGGKQLRGGALWHDAVMRSPQRILIEILRWAGRLGAVALNYCEARSLLTDGGRVRGVVAHDRIENETRTFHADRVINCAGAEGLALARRLGCEAPERLWYPSLAANVLLDRSAPSSAALAVADERPGGRVYFMYPIGGRLYAGTAHFPRPEGETDPRLSVGELYQMLDGLNAAAPWLRLRPESVLRVCSGLLPVRRPGTVDLTGREAVHHHARSGGPAGLWTVRGIKYTTARRVAEKALRAAFAQRWRELGYRPGTERVPRSPEIDLIEPDEMLSADGDRLQPEVERMVREESAACAQDIVYRRTDWARDPEAGQRVIGHLRDAVPLLRSVEAEPPPAAAQRDGRLAPAAGRANRGASGEPNAGSSNQRQGGRA